MTREDLYSLVWILVSGSWMQILGVFASKSNVKEMYCLRLCSKPHCCANKQGSMLMVSHVMEQLGTAACGRFLA